MKELEGEVLDLLVELGDDQYVAEITGHTITPENFLGLRSIRARQPSPSWCCGSATSSGTSA